MPYHVNGSKPRFDPLGTALSLTTFALAALCFYLLVAHHTDLRQRITAPDAELTALDPSEPSKF